MDAMEYGRSDYMDDMVIWTFWFYGSCGYMDIVVIQRSLWLYRSNTDVMAKRAL